MALTESNKTARRSLGELFACLFKKYPKLLIANLLFAVPLAVSVLIVWLIGEYVMPLNIFFQLLPVLICMPFYAGMTQVTRELVRGKPVKPFETFMKGLKNNFRQFLIHGVIMYLAILIDYFSIVFYFAAAKTNGMFYFLFGFCLLVMLFLVFLFFYVPLITVTIDQKLRHIYKNAALMAIWELPANLCALIGLVVLTAVISTIFMLTGNYTANLIIAGVLAVLVVPGYVSVIINYFAFPKIEKVLILGQREAEKGKDKGEKETPSQSLEEELENNPEAESLLREKAKGNEEYVFHNGRMIKRSLLEEYYAGEPEDDGDE